MWDSGVCRRRRQRPVRQPHPAPPPLRAVSRRDDAVMTTRAERLERYARAPAPDDEGRALALHGPQGLRSRRVGCERRDGDRGAADDARARRVGCRVRRRSRHRDRLGARRDPLRAAARGSRRSSTRSSAGTRSSPRTTRRCGRTGCSSTSRAASCSRSRSTSGSRTRSRAGRSSGGSSSSPSPRAASR